LTAALATQNDRVVGHIDCIAGAVQIDQLLAAHHATQRDNAGFCARSAERVAAARQSRELHRGKRSHGQTNGQKADQTSPEQFKMPESVFAAGQLWIVGGDFICRAFVAEGGRKKTYLHRWHLEKRLRTRHLYTRAFALRACGPESDRRWRNEVFLLTRSSAV
jgi:hypothetical protein